MNRKKSFKWDEFIVGLILFAVGFYILAQKTVVTTNYFSRFRMSGGLVVLPLILGIVWYVMTKSFVSKLVMLIAVIFLIVYIIMNTSIYLMHTSLFDWILMLGLMGVGGGLMLKQL